MKLPNGSKTPPLLQMIHWIADPMGYMEACAQQYGDIFTAPVAGSVGPLVFISHPQAMQQMLTHDTKEFEVPGGLNEIFKPLVGEQSLILLSGDRHRSQRQLLTPPFHGERMRAYGELICDLTKQVSSKWAIGKTFTARETMQEITLGVILGAVFGLNEGPRYQKLTQLLSSALELLSSPLNASLLYFTSMQRDLGPWSPWGRFVRQQRQIDELLYAEIQARRSQPDSDRSDILSLMMSARYENGEAMTDEELHDELLTLLFAGHETTATALAWALYWTHHLPEVGQKVREELATLGENPDPSAIFRLPYLSAVCSETLRIYPVGMLTFPRVVKSPVHLSGQQLDPGTIVVGSIYLTHQREDIYPQPKQFKPERFLERQFSPYEYLPFGGGARRCIGMALAQFEMKLVLATILSNWDLALADSRPVRAQRRGLTASPAGGVKMVAIARREKVAREVLAMV